MDKDRIAGSANDFAGKVEDAVGDIAGDAKTQAAGRAREAAGTVQNLYGQAKDAARDASDAAVSYARDAYDNSGETFRDGSQALAKKVQDNPLGSLLIAGGIGFALAMLMTRPPRRPPPRWRYYSCEPHPRHSGTRVRVRIGASHGPRFAPTRWMRPGMPAVRSLSCEKAGDPFRASDVAWRAREIGRTRRWRCRLLRRVAEAEKVPRGRRRARLNRRRRLLLGLVRHDTLILRNATNTN